MINLRKKILVVVMTLVCLGAVFIYSASSVYALQNMSDSAYFLKRHIFSLLMAVVLSLFVMGLDYRILKRMAKPFLFISVVLLVILLIPGLSTEAGGAKRWFRFLGFGFQPSHLAQLALIVYMADFASRKKDLSNSFIFGFLPPMVVLGLVMLLVLAQPDLGTAISIAMVIFVMLFVSGVRFAHMLSVFLLSIPFLYILIFSVPYRRKRIMSFINPWLDPQGSGFQIIQSQIALGSGGFFGVGLGMSKQKLLFLPAAHTDFIFSIIGEELGIIGTISTIMLFFLFAYYGFMVAYNTKDKFGRLLAIGLVLLITVKAVINIGVSCAFFPTKGLPLPFISYGGSALVIDMISVALLLNISRANS